jgi:predicted lactoylglutathione lyase
MKVRLIWGNYVSADLQRTADFYTALGFKRNDNMEDGEFVSFVFGETSHFIINFFTEKRLGDPMNGGLTIPKTNELIFSLSADSVEEVDQWAEKVKHAGGEIFSKPQKFQQGYTFAFSDPDGHKFNFLYWPGM